MGQNICFMFTVSFISRDDFINIFSQLFCWHRLRCFFAHSVWQTKHKFGKIQHMQFAADSKMLMKLNGKFIQNALSWHL